MGKEGIDLLFHFMGMVNPFCGFPERRNLSESQRFGYEKDHH
jgi:hypothetical protein